VVGSVLAVGLIIISPTVWVDLFHFKQAIFPWKNPALISMTASFLAGWLGSVLVPEPEAKARYEEQKIRNYLGVGVE